MTVTKLKHCAMCRRGRRQSWPTKNNSTIGNFHQSRPYSVFNAPSCLGCHQFRSSQTPLIYKTPVSSCQAITRNCPNRCYSPMSLGPPPDHLILANHSSHSHHRTIPLVGPSSMQPGSKNSVSQHAINCQ